jgi:general secretion pathway protein G
MKFTVADRSAEARAAAAGDRRRDGETSRGFTMMELMVVIAIILVLIGMAAGRYEKSVVRAREAVLKQDLQTMRSAIQQYTLDKAAAPQSLDDLVSAGYLREVPVDPMTRARDWHTDFDNVLLSTEQTAPGIDDVHSVSDASSPFESTPYSSW